MADKTKAELEAENADLRAQVELYEEELKKGAKIALMSRGQLPRNRGTYTIPPNEPIVLSLESIDEENLAEIMNDPHVMKVRTDSPLTPENEVVRY